ncbi:hypothetical protein C5167_020589 [Papaver somniferum]|uniref:JmjN domain-containing protein n=1 Tax=Papaver somniferum TaxID=3469 RepID=A0A4Y7IXF3_PAPSO|nr:hypothetical protein C5167_020589 [Papaver somniferum]
MEVQSEGQGKVASRSCTKEFNDTLKYIDNIRSKAEPYRICRIVPPSSWRPHCPLKENSAYNKSTLDAIHLQLFKVNIEVSIMEEVADLIKVQWFFISFYKSLRLARSGRKLKEEVKSGLHLEAMETSIWCWSACWRAFAIGARSQSAKTYLERKLESFANSTRDDVIKDVLFAIKETLQGEKLTRSICTVVVVGLEKDFYILDQETIQEFIELLEIREEAPVQEEAEVPPPAPMDIGDLCKNLATANNCC